MAFIKQNRVKVLATSSKQRLPYLPEVPTIEEAGLKGFEVAPWQGLLGPAGLRRAIVDQLYTEVVKLLRLPEVRERLAATGSDPVGSTPAEFAAQIKRELKQFGKVIKAAGIKTESELGPIRSGRARSYFFFASSAYTSLAYLTADLRAGAPEYTPACFSTARISSQLQPLRRAPRICNFSSCEQCMAVSIAMLMRPRTLGGRVASPQISPHTYLVVKSLIG